MAEENDGAAVGIGDVGEAPTMKDVEDANAKDEADFSAGFADDGGSAKSDDGGGDGSDAGDTEADSKADTGDESDADADADDDLPPRDKSGRFTKAKDDGDGEDDGDGDDDGGEEDDKPPKETKPAKDDKPKVRSSSELIADAIAAFDDGEIVVGGAKVNVKEYIEDYPEEAGAAAVIAAKIVEKALEGFSPKAGGGDKIAERIQELEDDLLAFRFWDSVSYDYPDARRTVATQGFKDWIEKQPKGIKKLAVSVDPDDAKTVLGMYSKETAAAKKPTPAAPAKAKAVALYSDSGRSGGGASSGSKDDFDAGFNL